MDNIIIRKAKIEDLKDVQVLRDILFKYEIEKLDNHITDVTWTFSKDGEEDLIYFINEQILYVAEINNKIVGYICGEMLPKKEWNLFQIAEIINLCVKEEYRNMKIGTLLINKFKEVCKEKNIKHISVATLSNNDAIKFYNKNGFSIHSVQMLTEI